MPLHLGGDVMSSRLTNPQDNCLGIVRITIGGENTSSDTNEEQGTAPVTVHLLPTTADMGTQTEPVLMTEEFPDDRDCGRLWDSHYQTDGVPRNSRTRGGGRGTGWASTTTPQRMTSSKKVTVTVFFMNISCFLAVNKSINKFKKSYFVECYIQEYIPYLRGR